MSIEYTCIYNIYIYSYTYAYTYTYIHIYGETKSECERAKDGGGEKAPACNAFCPFAYAPLKKSPVHTDMDKYIYTDTNTDIDTDARLTAAAKIDIATAVCCSMLQHVAVCCSVL